MHKKGRNRFGESCVGFSIVNLPLKGDPWGESELSYLKDIIKLQQGQFKNWHLVISYFIVRKLWKIFLNKKKK